MTDFEAHMTPNESGLYVPGRVLTFVEYVYGEDLPAPTPYMGEAEAEALVRNLSQCAIMVGRFQDLAHLWPETGLQTGTRALFETAPNFPGTERERNINLLHTRYGLKNDTPLTNKQTAQNFGIAPSRVRQIIISNARGLRRPVAVDTLHKRLDELKAQA